MGKGDKRRPTEVDEKVFEDRWNKVFGARKPNGGQTVRCANCGKKRADVEAAEHCCGGSQ